MNTLRGALRPNKTYRDSIKTVQSPASPDCQPLSKYKKAQTTHESPVGSRCLERIKTLLSLRQNPVPILMKRVLLQRLLCLLDHVLLLAQMIKELRQRMKDRCRPKNL